jgi:hypothetical protein
MVHRITIVITTILINTMNYDNHSLNQEYFPAGLVRLKAKTKKRQGLNGLTNRGLLIVDESGQERWVSLTDASITELPLGSQLYFNGQGARPSLTIPQAYSQQHQSLGEAIQNGYSAPQQQSVDFENNARAFTNQQVMSQPQNNNAQIQPNINESLLESTCYLLSNAVNLMSSLNPQLSEESIVKLAISAAISYSQQIKDMPF